MAIKAVDLFSGCGGVSCGLSRAGFLVQAAVEIEPTAVETYLNYPPHANVKVLKKDICEISGSALLKAAKIRRNDIFWRAVLLVKIFRCKILKIDKSPKRRERNFFLSILELLKNYIRPLYLWRMCQA